MKFDYTVFKPPYQQDNEKNSRAKPLYNLFMDEAQKVSNRVEVIHPARFLFNAGQTPKKWNEKMLNDEHFKVLRYEPNGSNIFPNTDIKGGVAITYWDSTKDFGAIVEFIEDPILNSLARKIKDSHCASLSDIHYNRSSYRFTNQLYTENESCLNQVKESEKLSISSNIFDKLPTIFFENKPSNDFYAVYGRDGNSRKLKYVKKSYLADHDNLTKWKVFVAKSNGTGKFGECLTTPEVIAPFVAGTQTFISFGKFDNEDEATALSKYLKTKFARCLLDICKVTPDNARKEVWRYVPLENFSSNSDIDWSKSIPEIDQQLYRKYGLSEKEINFIETNVKEMN